MNDEAASWEDALLSPVTGTFRTSWRAVYAGWFWSFLIGMAIASALILLDGGDVEVLLGVMAFLGAVGALLLAAGYRLFGVRSVEIAEDVVTVEPFSRDPIRLRRDELVQMWQQKKWYFETRERSVDVREYGFTTDDWVALSFALYDWQDAGPVETLPGVVARSKDSNAEGPPETAIFEPQHSSALWWVGPLFGVVMFGTFIASWSSYGDGTWIEEPVLSVLCPLVGFAFVVLTLKALPRLVRRVAFLPDSLVFERFVGKPVAMPYTDISDVYRQSVVTQQGRFLLSDRNSGAFLRLLEPHLEAGQLSGKMSLRAEFDFKYLFYEIGASIVLGFLASLFLPSVLGLPASWLEVMFLAGFLGGVGIATLIARSAFRREMKRGLDS